MVPAFCKNGKICICVDLKRLNQSVARQNHTLPVLDDIIHRLAGSTVFSKLDAVSGFWQISLPEDNAELTTFITPFGRYYFRRLPFGITSAPEIFQLRMEDILRGLPGVEVIMDDILINGRDERQHDVRLQAAINRISQSGLKLNRDMCSFEQSQLSFMGHVIGQDGTKPDPEKIQAILDLKPPNNVTETGQLPGMVQCQTSRTSQGLWMTY